MAEAFLSSIWYRVAELAPRLRPHVSVSRHRYRGRAWYVLYDPASGRSHRFTPAVHRITARFDGRRTVDQVWRELSEGDHPDAPSQDDMIRLLSQLHQSDLIQYAGSPEVTELLERHDRQARQVLKQNALNPMSFRVPLFDPDRLLTVTLPWVRWATGWFGLVLWLLVAGAGLVTAAMHWQPLSRDVGAQLLSAQNLLITLVTYPLLKALHELAHGWLAKARGVEVREMGIMFLVFFPVPYVDASAAAALPSKWSRAAVGMGGIWIETFVAAVAVMVWASVEPGWVSAVAWNLVMIGGLSTVIVNGNPLLKFDGYYVLADLLEIPNLAQRASRFYGHLIQRHVFRARNVREEIATQGERVWFLLYAPAAFVYRLVVMVGIAMFVAQEFFVAGVLLAVWSVFQSLVKPAWKAFRHVFVSPQLRKVRRRAVAITLGTLGAAAAALSLIPAPLHTDTEGVIWLPDAAHVRARAAGFVADLPADRGAEVAPGTALLRLEEPTLDAAIAALRWRVTEYERRLAAAEVSDRAGAPALRSELDEARSRLAREERRRADLVVRAPAAGRFEPLIPPVDAPGRFVKEGDLVGYVAPERAEIARILVLQDDIALVRDRLRKVEVKLAGHLEERHEARVLRAVPAALGALPSPALGPAGGGRFLTDPTDPEGMRMLEAAFVLDLALPPDLAEAPFGARVLVRFAHDPEPVAAQVWRRLRQLLLRQFDV